MGQLPKPDPFSVNPTDPIERFMRQNPDAIVKEGRDLIPDLMNETESKLQDVERTRRHNPQTYKHIFDLGNEGWVSPDEYQQLMNRYMNAVGDIPQS